VLATGAVALGVAIVIELSLALVAVDRFATDSFDATTLGMAQRLFVPARGAHLYLYAFLATSILITSALVGAILLSKKDLDGEKLQ
jgi:NADH:ubiquinone oxidoreductase subunit 6 (subunit J)